MTAVNSYKTVEGGNCLKTAECRVHQEQTKAKTSVCIFWREGSYPDPLLNGLHRDPPKQSLQFAK